jgi:hypothetical protein
MKMIPQCLLFTIFAGFLFLPGPLDAQSAWYNKIRQVTRLIYHSFTNKQTRPEEMISLIDRQFKDFERWIVAEEEKVLTATKNKYGISDALWNKCLEDIEKVKKSYAISMKSSHPAAFHDPAMPIHIKDMLIEAIRKNNIHPNSISILMADEAKIAAKANVIAETILPITITYEGNEVIVHTDYMPAQITFFPRMLTALSEKRIITVAHELQHIISQHGVTENILLAHLQHYHAIDETVFKKTAEYYHLCQIHEAQAEVLAALSDPRTAHHMKNYRKDNQYPGYLYEEHFYCLSTIDTLWQLRKKVEALYGIE